jgi:hypothetical protein
MLLGAALAAVPLLFGSAKAASPGELVVYDAAGHPLGVLMPFRGVAEAAAPSPAADMWNVMFPDFSAIFAQQAAMMRRLTQQIAQMETSMPAGGSQMVVTSFSSGQGSCSRTVTYSFSGNNPQPQVAVRQVGDACGDMMQPRRGTVPVTQPAPAQPAGSKLLQVEYRHPDTSPSELRG